MSKAEKFIEEHTRNCSNQYDLPEYFENGIKRLKEYQPWLTPDQARIAVEIAREEIMEKACDTYCKICGHYAHMTPTHICRHACDYYKDFEQAMKDE